jgi:hypothetical protein
MREAIVCPEAPVLHISDWKKVVFVVATDNEGIKVIGMDEEQYRNLAYNTQTALEAIRDRNLINSYYKECIQKHNEDADK